MPPRAPILSPYQHISLQRKSKEGKMQTEKTGFGPQEHSGRAAESWHNSGCVQTKEDDRAFPTDCLTRPTTLRGTLTRRGMF